MIGPNTGTPSRKPIILIGAPSGAGKTVLSEQIIAGALPVFAQLCPSIQDGTPVCYDLKLLPQDPPRDRTVIIECATHKFEQLTQSLLWQRMLAVVCESEHVLCVSLNVPPRTVALQYFFRIFTEPKRLHWLTRIVQLSKYRNTLIYLLTHRLARANAAWGQFGRQLAAEMSPRVALVCVRRSGGGYSVHTDDNALGCQPRVADGG